MNELMFSQLSQPRFATILLSAFAGLAIVLTVVGLYGVMTYSVSRRTREIGVRMALGAQRSAVLAMVLRDAAILLGAGIVIGIAGALASGSVLQDMLYGTGARNPAVLMMVGAGVAVAGLAAAYIPAFRAAKVDPMVALRYE
jgi:putative ABC transport system permease protein